MLGEEVLDDPAHADVRAFLAALARVGKIDPALRYDGETSPDDAVALDELKAPTWRDAGVRSVAGESRQ